MWINVRQTQGFESYSLFFSVLLFAGTQLCQEHLRKSWNTYWKQ